jgi:ABC-type transport system involved in multi-copper enzyme maturation permease subunit
MSVFLSLPLIFAQAQNNAAGFATRWRATLEWLLVLGEPTATLAGLIGGLLTWLKIVSLFCLLGWVLSWITTAFKERTAARAKWLDIAALIAVAAGLVALTLRVMEYSHRVERPFMIGDVSLAAAIGSAAGFVLFVWLEATLWSTIGRLGRRADLFVLGGIHLALIAGFGLGVIFQQAGILTPPKPEDPPLTVLEGFFYGARLSATYMGYVVLARVAGLVLIEIISLRWRRIYAIAKLTVIEANRRMWAPWVVLTVFLVVLAFTHWFLVPPRAAEMGRLFVGTLALLCSLLLTVMVTILTPLSLPSDIQYQTIYTVVSKPVRRIELIWGRILGFMTIVTVLVGVFGGISLLYLWRTVGGTIQQTEISAEREASANRTIQANHLFEEAEQLRTRMSAREPILGALTFLDSRGTPHNVGVDVGMEQTKRSHIEGATPATAIWMYGIVPNPFNPQGRIDRRIPVARLLPPDSIEGLQNRAVELYHEAIQAEGNQAKPGTSPADAQRYNEMASRLRQQQRETLAMANKREAEAKALTDRAAQAESDKKLEEAKRLRDEAAELHAPPIELQMIFNVYRTTKGRVGDPVIAEIEVSNPFPNPFGASLPPWHKIFDIHEYYTNREYVPAKYLVGSLGGLKIEIRCVSPSQYLGMAEGDLYILAHSGRFGWNYMKALFGVWLQALVLTAIGVFAGTFLSWPVALLTTIAFFVGGQIAFSVLLEFTKQSMQGGGPFESLIRLLTHDNQMTELAPTLAVVTARTFDAIVMPVMSRLVYVVPNFSALDVSNTVADGFAVPNAQLVANLLLALAYALPFSVAGYFILKNREVAA